MDWGVKEQSLGLVCSQPRPLPTELIDELSSPNRPWVQVGFGGLGLRFSPELFAHWPDLGFLMAAPVHPDVRAKLKEVPNILLLPKGIRPLDAFPFCSRHLGKPGFSTFSEAIAQDVGLHVVERRGFAEADALLMGLQQHGRHRLLNRVQFENGDWELDQPLEAPAGLPLSSDGALQAAHCLIDLSEKYAS